MNKTICECCSSKHINDLGRYNDFSHFLCNDCGFEFFMHEGPTTNSRLYENDHDYADDLSVSANYRDLLQWQHLIALRYIAANKNDNPSILDVGCFNGFFVKTLYDMGYDARGIDFNQKAIAYGKDRYGLGQRIAVKDINELINANETFDVITLFDVIEHVDSPRELLSSLKGMLKKGGVLILSAPNNKMIWRPDLDYPPHHLTRYNPQTIARFLTDVGYRNVEQFEQMNVFNLVRNLVGSFFRDANDKSLRGGRLRSDRGVNVARTALNRLRRACCFILYPLDRLLYLFGLRYVGQLVISERIE